MSDAIKPILLLIKELSPKDKSLLLATLSLDAPTWVLDRQTQIVLEEVFLPFKVYLLKYEIDIYHYSVLLKSKYKDTFVAGCLSMKKYVDTNFKYSDHRQLNHILNALMAIITDYMVAIIKIPLCAKTLSEQMKNVEYIVDLCFPGYRQNKLLNLIISPEQDLREI
jgi:hypothetical protein